MMPTTKAHTALHVACPVMLSKAMAPDRQCEPCSADESAKCKERGKSRTYGNKGTLKCQSTTENDIARFAFENQV